MGNQTTHLSTPWLLDQLQEVYAQLMEGTARTRHPEEATSVGPRNLPRKPQLEWINWQATLSGHGWVPHVKTTELAHGSGHLGQAQSGPRSWGWGGRISGQAEISSLSSHLTAQVVAKSYKYKEGGARV